MNRVALSPKSARLRCAASGLSLLALSAAPAPSPGRRCRGELSDSALDQADRILAGVPAEFVVLDVALWRLTAFQLRLEVMAPAWLSKRLPESLGDDPGVDGLGEGAASDLQPPLLSSPMRIPGQISKTEPQRTPRRSSSPGEEETAQASRSPHAPWPPRSHRVQCCEA